MRSKAIFMALLALAFAAQGARVSQSEAAGAASAWARSGEKLGVRIGYGVKSVREFAVTNGYSFYVVGLDGGTVIMTSDTTFEPVVAFTSREDLDMSEGSPLFKLLNGDVASRVSFAVASQSASTSASASSASSAQSQASSLWAALLGGASSGGGVSPQTAASAKPLPSVSDVRVAPFVKSQWSQDYVDDEELVPCYNYYTPLNFLCGCTATAMAQIMRYFEWPKTAVEPLEYDCTVKVGNKVTPVALTMQGGVYDWENMTLVPEEALDAGTLSEENCQAIGKLASDAGIAVKSDYSEDVTGASPQDVAAALRDAFGYRDAICYWNETGWNSGVGGLHNLALRKRVIYANLDARQPVQLAIYGYSAKHVGDSNYWAGHAVVADGYGFTSVSGVETAFVHVNMGWAGLDDMWYNIPEIDAANSGAHASDRGYSFLYIGGATFNISTNGTGLAILSGRVTDGSGSAVEGAEVRVYDSDGGLIGQTETDAYGIYSFKLLGDRDYRLEAASADGRSVAGIAPVTLPATTGLDASYVVTDASKVGNSWGNDMVLCEQAVRIVTGTTTNLYVSLDEAIVGARAIAASSGAKPELEILHPVNFNSDAVVDFGCVIRAATGDESSTLVNRPSGAKLTVAAGAELYVSNCVFKAEEGSFPVSVSAGGKVFVGPGFSGGVKTADADGFNVMGHVTSEIALDCAAAGAIGSVFGHAATTGDVAALSNSVARIYATFDDERETRGALQEVSPGTYNLAWSMVSIPPESSAGYYVDKTGTTRAFGRVDTLFERFDAARAEGLFDTVPEVVIVGFDEKGLSREISVSSGSVVIRGEGGARLKPTETSHIVVTNGSLVVKDVVIGDREDADTFIKVQSGGSMTLGSGAVLTNIICTGNSPKRDPGPISVETGGTLKLAAGSEIVGCAAIGSGGTRDYGGGRNGGGVYVYKDGTLDLAGGHIRDCWTVNGFGGGVYAIAGANVVVSGPSVVSGNSGKDGKVDDLYFNSQNDRVSVTNYVSGGSIGIRYGTSACNETNFVFAAATSAAIASAATNAPALFFNDVNPMLVAGVTNETELAWFVPEPPPIPPEDLVASFVLDGVTVTNGSLQAAFARLADATNVVTVTLYSNCTFTADLVVPCASVTLRSATASPVCVTQGGDCSFVVGDGASLAVENVVFTSAPEVYASVPLFSVAGGSLEFRDGAEVSGASFMGRAAAAVTVRDGKSGGGTFKMYDGASISSCTNYYLHTPDRTAFAAGLLVNGKDILSVAHLYGGTISNCVAYRTGGAYVGNKGRIYVSGGVEIVDNSSSVGNAANLSVAADSGLVLEDGLTGSIGVRRDTNADKVLFGTVSTNFYESASKSNVVASAMNFTSDDGYGYGVAASKDDGGDMYLVWSENFGADGTYTPVTDPSVPFPVDPPTAATWLSYNGMAQTGVVAHVGYDLSGVSVATNAGSYTSVATLSPGYEWSDGSKGDKTNAWAIAKGTIDMSGVVFRNATVRFDGNAKKLEISGTLPSGVASVSYDPSTGKVQPGVYEFTAKFNLSDSANYNSISSMKATLRIVRVVAMPTGIDGLVYNAAVQSGVEASPNYVISGEVAGINAGDYTAVVTPASNCSWPDDLSSTGAVKVTWSIARAPLTIVASNAWKLVGAADPASFAYAVEGLQGDDAAADVLSGSLVRDAGEDIGMYSIKQGSLKVKDGDPKNYEIATYKSAFFSILGEAPGPEPGPTPVDPLPVAFTAVADGSGTWTLTITTAVEKCWYSLYETNSLSGGFKIDDVSPVELRQATEGDAPTMNFARPANGSQLFWKVRAEPSNAH